MKQKQFKPCGLAETCKGPSHATCRHRSKQSKYNRYFSLVMTFKIKMSSSGNQPSTCSRPSTLVLHYWSFTFRQADKILRNIKWIQKR